MAEESKSPGDAEQQKQTHDGEQTGSAGLSFVLLWLKETNLSHCYDENGGGEDEHDGIITNVYPLVNSSVWDPTPAKHLAE